MIIVPSPLGIKFVSLVDVRHVYHLGFTNKYYNVKKRIWFNFPDGLILFIILIKREILCPLAQRAYSPPVMHMHGTNHI